MVFGYYDSEKLKKFTIIPEKYEEKVEYIDFLRNFPLKTYSRYSNNMGIYYLNYPEKLDTALKMREIFESLQEEIRILLKSFEEFSFKFIKHKDIYLDFRNIVYWMDLFVNEFIPFREKFKQDVIENLIKNVEMKGFKAISFAGTVKIIKPMNEYVEIETISLSNGNPNKSSIMIKLTDFIKHPDEIELNEKVIEAIEEMYPEITF